MPKATQQLIMGGMRFLGEQNGTPETMLKKQLTGLFQELRVVTRAYLVTVDFGQGTASSVVLCLRSSRNAEGELIERIGQIFASIFNSQEHLDIIFAQDETERRVLAVCRPFFCADPYPGATRTLTCSGLI